MPSLLLLQCVVNFTPPSVDVALYSTTWASFHPPCRCRLVVLASPPFGGGGAGEGRTVEVLLFLPPFCVVLSSPLLRSLPLSFLSFKWCGAPLSFFCGCRYPPRLGWCRVPFSVAWYCVTSSSWCCSFTSSLGGAGSPFVGLKNHGHSEIRTVLLNSTRTKLLNPRKQTSYILLLW